MGLLDIDGLREVRGRDRHEVLRLLRRRPEFNVYLLGQVARGGLSRRGLGGFIGFSDRYGLQGVCSLGPNLVFSTPTSDEALEAFAEYARARAVEVRVAVGEDRRMKRFMDAYGRRHRPIRIERGGQVLFAVRGDTLAADARAPDLRPADIAEIRQVVEADRRMVDEELGFNPFLRDVESYEEGWRRRVREARAYIVGDMGELPRFKLEQSAVSPDGIQLSGVWTDPRFRRQGLAYRAVGEMCHRLLRQVPVVTLYVNEANTPAVRLYERLGFQAVGRVRSVWFE